MKLYEKRLEKAKYRCERCFCRSGLQMHHVFSGSGRRKKAENIDTVMILCYECHAEMHRDPALTNKVRAHICRKMIDKHGEEKAREMLGGRLYFYEGGKNEE